MRVCRPCSSYSVGVKSSTGLISTTVCAAMSRDATYMLLLCLAFGAGSLRPGAKHTEDASPLSFGDADPAPRAVQVFRRARRKLGLSRILVFMHTYVVWLSGIDVDEGTVLWEPEA